MSGVRLRCFSDSDIPDLLASWEDDQIKLWWGVGATDAAGARAWVASRNEPSGDDFVPWAITDSSDRLLGMLRLSYRYPDGELHDEHLHAVLRDEWKE